MTVEATVSVSAPYATSSRTNVSQWRHDTRAKIKRGCAVHAQNTGMGGPLKPRFHLLNVCNVNDECEYDQKIENIELV